MKYKFKIGDKVKIIKYNLSTLAENHIGQIITIICQAGHNEHGNDYGTNVCNEGSGRGCGIYENELELVGIRNPNSDIILKEV